MEHPTLVTFQKQAGLIPGSIVLDDLAGARIAVDADAPIYPASIIKVPLVAAALILVEANELDLAMPVTISERNMTANDAESPLVPGFLTTLEDLCERAIGRSDNVATNELFDLIGRDRATSLVHDIGLANTHFARKLSGSDPLIVDAEWDGSSRNRHPASDAAKLLRSIARNEYPWSSQIAAMLHAQAWNDKLSPGLLPGDTFAHKTGDTSEVTHDAGILRTHDGRVYVLVVYAAIESNEANNARFGAFMRALRPLL